MTDDAGSRFYPRIFGLAASTALALAVFRMLQPFIGAILWSILLAFLLHPANRSLRRALGGRPAAAAVLLTIAAILLLLVPAFTLAVAFTAQAAELFRRLQAAAGHCRIARPSDLLGIPVVHQLLHWAETVAPVDTEQVQGWLVNAATTLLQLVVATSGVFVVEALGTIVSLAVTLFLLFFLRDGEDIVARALRLVPLDAERQAHLVPLFGTALVWAPAAAVFAIQSRWGAAIFMVAWGIVVVSGSDNVVRPLFISGRAQISTLPVFLGLAGGLSAFGPIGMVLGPVIVALVLALLRFAEESRQAPPAATGASG